MDSKVKGLMGDSFENLRTLIDVNTIIGDPITTPDGTTIIPVSKVTFGYGMGGSDLPTNKREAFGGATAGGVTIQPIAFLIVKDGNVQLVQLAGENNTAERAMNLVPDVVDKVTSLFQKEDRKEEPLPQAPAQPVEPVPQDV